MKILEEIDTLILPESFKDSRMKRKGLVKRVQAFLAECDTVGQNICQETERLQSTNVALADWGEAEKAVLHWRQAHQLCHLWSRSYPPSPELLGATGPLPFPSLTPALNEQASSIQSLASCQLLVLSLWICAVQQPTFSGECPLTKSSQLFGPLGTFFGLVRALMYPEVVLSISAILVFRSMRPFCAYDPINLSV